MNNSSSPKDRVHLLLPFTEDLLKCPKIATPSEKLGALGATLAKRFRRASWATPGFVVFFGRGGYLPDRILKAWIIG